MINILITFLTFVLILIGIFMVLVILMQRANTNGGMGSAFGGGMADSAFGAETTNVLTKATKWSGIAFFVLSFVLYLLWMKQATIAKEDDGTALPIIAEETTEVPSVDGMPAQTEGNETIGEVTQTIDDTIDAGENATEETADKADESPNP